MPKRYYPQKTAAQQSVIKAYTNKIKRKRSAIHNETIMLPEIISLIILSDSTIKCCTTIPHMNSATFETKEKLYNSCAIASLLISNYNLKFITSPHLLCETPQSFVASNNLNFPQKLGNVSGLTKNQKFIKLDYEDFCKRIISLLTNNQMMLNPRNSESLYNYLPTDSLKKHATKSLLKIANELHKINSDPYYLHILYESVQVLLTTNKNNSILKEEK